MYQHHANRPCITHIFILNIYAYSYIYTYVPTVGKSTLYAGIIHVYVLNIHTYSHIYVYTYMYTYTSMYMYIHICIHIHTCIYTYIHTYICVHKHICVQAPLHAGGSVSQIELKATNGWQIDVAEVQAAIRPDTRYMVINQPYNPAGKRIYMHSCTYISM